MACGVPPFDEPKPTDRRFTAIANGQLLQMVRNWGFSMSDALGDLILKMLRVDPNERITLVQALQHQWVLDPDVDGPVPPPPPAWSN